MRGGPGGRLGPSPKAPARDGAQAGVLILALVSALALPGLDCAPKGSAPRLALDPPEETPSDESEILQGMVFCIMIPGGLLGMQIPGTLQSRLLRPGLAYAHDTVWNLRQEPE